MRYLIIILFFINTSCHSQTNSIISFLIQPEGRETKNIASTLRQRFQPDTGIYFIIGKDVFENGGGIDGSCLEPTILVDRDSIRIFYTGSNSSTHHQVGMRVGTNMDDTSTFFHRGALVGQGVGGAPLGRSASSSCVVKVNGIYYMWALDGYGYPGDTREVFEYKSTDSYNWTQVDTAFKLSMIAGAVGYGNTCIWPEVIDGYYHGLTDIFIDGIWQQYRVRATNIEGPWQVVEQMTDLQVGGTGMYGGGQLKYYKDKWHVFYHYAPYGGNQPTYLAYATISQDFSTVNIIEAPFKPITIYPYGVATTQIGDAWVEEVNGSTYLLAEFVDNDTSPTRNQIRMWKFNYSFYELIKGL